MPKEIIVPYQEDNPDGWDSINNRFVVIKGTDGGKFTIEHSLVSVRKWEEKYKISFLDNFQNRKLTNEQLLDYIRCMTITQNVNPDLYNHLTRENIIEINDYINDPMSATIITDNAPEGKRGKTSKKRILTAELIYAWMIILHVPQEYQKWHLNKLLTLIKVIDVEKNGGNEKSMSKGEILRQNAAINAARKKALHKPH